MVIFSTGACGQDTASPLFTPYPSFFTYQSTGAIRKRHLYVHISRLMQSENGILLLFYIFLSHGNEKKNKLKKNEKRGDAVFCPQAPVIFSITETLKCDLLPRAR